MLNAPYIAALAMRREATRELQVKEQPILDDRIRRTIAMYGLVLEQDERLAEMTELWPS